MSLALCLAAPLLLAQAAPTAAAETGCKASLPDKPAAAPATAAPATAGPATAAPASATAIADPGDNYFDPKADARADMDTALADAARTGRSAALVFGADWCHDSLALARVLTSPAFRDEFGPRYSVTFIDVGMPQTGKGRNIELLARFKVKELKGTPAMFVVGPDGRLRNKPKDALSWRNAASRGPAATLDWFRKLKR